MSLIITKAIRSVSRPLLLEQRRHRSKVNIQKPRKPFYLRGVFNQFVEPFYPTTRPAQPLWELCGNVKRAKEKRAPKEAHPYEVILARECLNWYNSSRMIAFFHKNSMKAEDELDFKILVKRDNMDVRIWGPKVHKLAIGGTKWEAALSLCSTPSLIVFGAEPNVEKLRKSLKSTPQLILLAGIIDGKLLDLNDFVKYGKMDITEARAGLVQTLQSAAGVNLCRQLTHHQKTLVTRLGQIGKAEIKEPSTEET